MGNDSRNGGKDEIGLEGERLDIDDFLLDSQNVDPAGKRVKNRPGPTVRGISTTKSVVFNKKLIYVSLVIFTGFGVVYLFSPYKSKSYIKDSSFDRIETDMGADAAGLKELGREKLRTPPRRGSRLVPRPRKIRRRIRDDSNISERSRSARKVRAVEKPPQEERIPERDVVEEEEREELSTVQKKTSRKKRVRNSGKSLRRGKRGQAVHEGVDPEYEGEGRRDFEDHEIEDAVEDEDVNEEYDREEEFEEDREEDYENP